MRTRALVQEEQEKELCEWQRLLGVGVQGENPYLIATLVNFIWRK